MHGLTSIVVVAADSGPLLQTCIASALASRADIEVVLVDNASSDGEVARARDAHSHDPRLRVLYNDSNAGFGPACNRGAAVARGDALLFLNPDCELKVDTVAALREALFNDARIGVLGVTVCDTHGRPARGNRRRDPTFRRALATISGLSRFESTWPALAGIEMPAVTGETLETLEAVSGACLLLPRAVFEHVGGFDEGYFLHAEDLDLCRRVRAMGFRVAIASALCVNHAQGSSSRHRPVFVARHKHRSMWRYFCRFDPAAKSPPLRGLVWAGIWTHFAVQAPLLTLQAVYRRMFDMRDN
ncbi:MAG: glycosyltransferase family 2 protein [Dokdonella sp.]